MAQLAITMQARRIWVCFVPGLGQQTCCLCRKEQAFVKAGSACPLQMFHGLPGELQFMSASPLAQVDVAGHAAYGNSCAGQDWIAWLIWVRTGLQWLEFTPSGDILPESCLPRPAAYPTSCVSWARDAISQWAELPCKVLVGPGHHGLVRG